MATPAAVLQILVVANTKQATTALTKTQASLQATTGSATKTSAAMQKLKTVAKFAGVALVAGVAVGAHDQAVVKDDR